MVKDWSITHKVGKGPYRWERYFPKKGYGLVRKRTIGTYQWTIRLSTSEGDIYWDEGEVATLEEALSIIEDSFELIEEVEDE